MNGERAALPPRVQALLRASQPPNGPIDQANGHDQSPVGGVLSRTLFRSPIVNKIVPARIRHRRRNDFVFVGDYHIELKELSKEGTLTSIATKTDFTARIRSAAVYGSDRYLAQDPDAFAELDIFSDLDVKSSPGPDDANGPSNLLVLTLESQELVFLFASVSSDGEVQFNQTTIPMPRWDTMYRNPGRFLAVDPTSRVLAVGASEKACVVYSLKAMEDVRKEFAQNPKVWSPVAHERIINIPGQIWNMDFLFPWMGHPSLAFLLFIVVAESGRLKAVLYDWEIEAGLGQILDKPRIFSLSHGAPAKNQLPNLLIPYRCGPSFTLIYDQEVVRYSGLLTGGFQSNSTPLRHQSRHPGSSSASPQWTAWVRPSRGSHISKDNVYLIREDGMIVYLAVDEDERESVMSAGHLDCTVGAAFASQSNDLRRPDYLICGGDGCSGSVYSIGWDSNRIPPITIVRDRSRVMHPVLVDTFENWSPTADLLVTSSTKPKSHPHSTRASIFTCAGRGPFGSVRELRYGLEAAALNEPQKDDFSNTTGVWAIPDYSQPVDGAFYVLKSTPTSTEADLQAGEEEDDSINDIEKSTATIAASARQVRDEPQSNIIQVTPKGIILLSSAQGAPGLRRIYSHNVSEGSIISAAAINETGGQLVVVAVRSETNTSLQLFHYDPDLEGEQILQFGSALPVETEVTCITISIVNGSHFAFVGTADGEVHAVLLTPNGLRHATKCSASPDIGDPSHVCQDLTVLESSALKEQGESGSILACGLRNGQLFTVALSFVKQEEEDGNSVPGKCTHGESKHNLTFIAGIIFETRNYIKLGEDAIRFAPDSSDECKCFAWCGSDFVQLDYTYGQTQGFIVSSIWITSSDQPGLQQTGLRGVARCPGWPDHIVCVTEDMFIVALLRENPSVVPRRLALESTRSQLGVTPKCVIYSHGLDCLVVGGLRTEEVQPPVSPSSNGQVRAKKGMRTSYSEIVFVRSSQRKTSTEETYEVLGKEEFQPGEKVLSMVEWSQCIRRGGYHACLIVGSSSSFASQSPDRPSGNVSIFSIKKRSDGTGRTSFVKAYPFPGPVNCLKLLSHPDHVTHPCPEHADTSKNTCQNKLLFSSGSELYLYHLTIEDSGKARFSEIQKVQLDTPIMDISMEKDLVIVSTDGDSVEVFRLSDDPNDPQLLRPFAKDVAARRALTCYPLTITPRESDTDSSVLSTTLLTATLNAEIVLHNIPAVASQRRSISPTLIAQLPRSLTRLRQGAFRAPWKADLPLGVHRNDIIGSSPDGTLLTFSFLSSAAAQLAAFLCSLAQTARNQRKGNVLFDASAPDGQKLTADPTFGTGRPLGGAINGREVARQGIASQWNPGRDAGKARYVNGDVLVEVLEMDMLPTGYLRKLIEHGEGGGDTPERVAERWTVLDMLAGKVGLVNEESSGTGPEGRQKLLERVVDWLRGVCDPGL